VSGPGTRPQSASGGRRVHQATWPKISQRATSHRRAIYARLSTGYRLPSRNPWHARAPPAEGLGQRLHSMATNSSQEPPRQFAPFAGTAPVTSSRSILWNDLAWAKSRALQ
jgi:hypothetical protein